jgi:hypothetical protein
VNRPGPAGLLILAAFAIVFIIELRTLLGMVGLEVTSSVYFPVAFVLLAAAFGALLLLPRKNGKRPTGT